MANRWPSWGILGKNWEKLGVRRSNPCDAKNVVPVKSNAEVPATISQLSLRPPKTAKSIWRAVLDGQTRPSGPRFTKISRFFPSPQICGNGERSPRKALSRRARRERREELSPWALRTLRTLREGCDTASRPTRCRLHYVLRLPHAL